MRGKRQASSAAARGPPQAPPPPSLQGISAGGREGAPLLRALARASPREHLGRRRRGLQALCRAPPRRAQGLRARRPCAKKHPWLRPMPGLACCAAWSFPGGGGGGGGALALGELKGCLALWRAVARLRQPQPQVLAAGHGWVLGRGCQASGDPPSLWGIPFILPLNEGSSLGAAAARQGQLGWAGRSAPA